MQLLQKLRIQRARVEPETLDEMDSVAPKKEMPRLPGKLRDRARSDEAGRDQSPRTPTTSEPAAGSIRYRANSWQKETAATPSTAASTRSGSTQRDDFSLSPEQINEHMSGHVMAMRNRFSQANQGSPPTVVRPSTDRTQASPGVVRTVGDSRKELLDLKSQNEELKASLEAFTEKEAAWGRREAELKDDLEGVRVQQYAVLEECADQLHTLQQASKEREQELQERIDALEMDVMNAKATAEALHKLQAEYQTLQMAYDEVNKSRPEVDGLRGGGTGGTSSPPVALARRSDGLNFAVAESQLRATLTKDGGASTEELRAAVAATEATVQEAKDALTERELRIGSTQATLDEAKRELAAKELRERRASYERLHAAIGGDDEEALESALEEARKTGVDSEEVNKAVAKLELLQSLTPEQKQARSRDKARASAKKEAFLMVRRDDVEGLMKVVVDFEDSDWKNWKDHVGRNLRKYADYQRATKTQAFFVELDAPPPPKVEELPPVVVVVPEPAEPEAPAQESTGRRQRSVSIAEPKREDENEEEKDEEDTLAGHVSREQEAEDPMTETWSNPFKKLGAYIMSALGDESSPGKRDRAGSEPTVQVRSRAGSVFNVRSRANSVCTYCPSEGAISAHARSRSASVDAVFATSEHPHLVRLRRPDGGEGGTVKMLLLQDEEEEAAQDGEYVAERKMSVPEPPIEESFEEDKEELSPEELERIAALKTPAFRAVCQDDTTKLAEILETVPREIWESWENKAGKNLLSLALERGSSAAYAVMERALGNLQERTWPSFEEREDVWVMLPGEVQPRRATVMEDTPSEAPDVLVEFWDGDDPASRVEHSLVTKVSM